MTSKKISIAVTGFFVAVSVYSFYQWIADKGVDTQKQLPAAVSTTADTQRNNSPRAMASAGAMVTVSAATNDVLKGSRSNGSEDDSSAIRIEAFTEPYRDLSISASEMGPLAEIRVHEGDIVRMGDVIAVMDDDVLRASLEVARRSMSVEGLLKSAMADMAMKQTELEKLKELRERNHASQQEVDRVETELKVADARLQSVREDLDIKRLEGKRIEAQLEQRIIRAPMDGVITELSRDAGEFVSPTDPTIARLVQLDPLLIVFSVPLAQRNAVLKDQTVSLSIGPANVPAEGVVEYVSPTPDSSNSSVRVKVRLPNADRKFQSGEAARLNLEILTVPTLDNASTPVANGSHETSARR